jgi:hypothetical protein
MKKLIYQCEKIEFNKMDNIETSRVIDYNPRYQYIPPNTKLVLASTPESVSYNVANGSGISETTLTFSIEPEGNFLDRSVVLKIPKIPLVFERTLAIGTPAGAKTLADFFGGYDAICMRQFGILNAISVCKLTIDGKLHHTCSDIGRNLNVLSMFYSKEDVHRYFQNAQPDVFSKYADYTSGLTTIKIITESNEQVDIRKPVYSSGGIFSDMSDAYSSRIPIFSTETTLTDTSTTANVVLHDQKCLIPFNLFGIPSDEGPLYNAKKILVTITLYGDWWRRIFSLRTVGTTEIKDIRFRRDKLTEFLPHLNYIVRTGTNNSVEKASRTYSAEVSIVETSANMHEFTVAGYGSKTTNQLVFDPLCIPKRSYIFVRALHTAADASHILKEARVADLYARIDSLKIKVNNKETTLAVRESSVLYDLAKQHGLNKSFEQAMYLNGFAVPIDYSETLSLEPGTLVGTPGTRNGGSPKFLAWLDFTNLSSETVVYQVGVLHVYQGMLTSHDNTWTLSSSFISAYDDDSGFQTFEQALMTRYNYVGGRDGGGIGSFFASFLPKIGNGLKNLVTSAFTDPNFRSTNAWNGPKAPLSAAQNGGATFDGHSPIGGFSQHSNVNNIQGGRPADLLFLSHILLQ